MSQSLVGRELTPNKFNAAPPTTTASSRRPRPVRNRSKAISISTGFMGISLADTHEAAKTFTPNVVVAATYNEPTRVASSRSLN